MRLPEAPAALLAAGPIDQSLRDRASRVIPGGMYGHQNAIYDGAFFEFFGLQPPTREPGFPQI